MYAKSTVETSTMNVQLSLMHTVAGFIVLDALILVAPASTLFARISVNKSFQDAGLSHLSKSAWVTGRIVQKTATLPVEFQISFNIDIKFDFSFYQAFHYSI